MWAVRKYLLLSSIPLALFCGFLLLQPKLPKRLRAGYFNSTPYMIASPNLPPRGFLIEIFEELAKRRGIELQWINTVGRVEPALESGEIDVYPQLLITPARKSRFALSEPWWEDTLVVLSKVESPVLASGDLNGNRISVFKDSYTATLIAKLFPNSIPVPVKTGLDAILPLCDGQVKAAVAEYRAFTLKLAQDNRPCPGLHFHIQPFPDLMLRYGVAARKGNEWLARDLQDTLLDMTMDGTSHRLGSRWNVYSANQIGMFRDQVRFRNQRTGLLVVLVILVALILAMARLYLRMKEARLEALKASNAQANFLANMSHEIRTPLNGILGMTSLLQDSALSPAQRSQLEAISESGELLLSVVNNCLDLAKMEAGKLKLESAAFSPGYALENVVQLLAPKAKAKGLSIASYFDPRITEPLSGDPNRFQQILFNLIGNAIKFTDTGYVWIEVTRLDNNALHILVEDSGIGIPPSSRQHLFERYTQLDNASTRRVGGTGLGLSIVRELIHAMGGDICYEPAPSQGSRFWVTLPFDLSKPAALPALNKKIAFDSADFATRRLLNLLLPQFSCSLVSSSSAPDINLEGQGWEVPIRQSSLIRMLNQLESNKIPEMK